MLLLFLNLHDYLLDPKIGIFYENKLFRSRNDLYFWRMRIENLYKPFEIESIQSSSYVMAEHKNTFFEMIFVLEGKGTQIINQHALPYAANKLFLVFPQDTHGFEIEETTHFFVLRFNRSFLKTQSKEWRDRLEYIFHNHSRLPGCILKNMEDKPLVRSVAEALLREQGSLSNQEVVNQLIHILITIAARNILLMNSQHAERSYDYKNPNLIIDYIQQHIRKPEALRLENIASSFSVSRNYIGEYFKARFGRSIREYIASYKLELIENKLQYTDARISEIAYEYGFKDVSHLNHFFKKMERYQPTEVSGTAER